MLVVRDWQGLTLAGRIVETEAYFGANDPAAHAFAGRTARTEVLFGRPGHAYVYTIYGLHACLNVSCEPEDHAGCVLIRAVEPVAGLPVMAQLRGLPADTTPRLLTSGPGRLCQALGITRPACNGLDLLDPASPLRLAADHAAVESSAGTTQQPGTSSIRISPRIGIRKAVELPLRFYLAGNTCVSGPRRKA
jgi:DNA-3-methyladenine glycosylase